VRHAVRPVVWTLDGVVRRPVVWTLDGVVRRAPVAADGAARRVSWPLVVTLRRNEVALPDV
jgi:hypothetical protein